jgi:hypothetical protein
MPRPTKELADIDCQLKHETEKAYLIIDADGKEAWVPKSLGEWDPAANRVDGVMTVPVWFAEKEGLV